ncbi:hypothetical protein [Pelagicoccus mobilis]|uniref:O-antigen ligase domain-containing protein n=1 Tax=Pelagicoccus mobilis TaxID=415221 RepID=A0A934RUG0_9BACT|nr:hypothetical protein [Pelagicoccus mobilis]MBK1876628.1 hypothetical protein [Pelagicoccus mobilis]
MNGPAIFITLALVILQFSIKRKWAFVPLLIAAIHTSHIPNIADFTTVRFVLVAGIIRSFSLVPSLFQEKQQIDKLIIIMGAVLLISGIGHDHAYGNPFKYRMGLILNITATYFYGRIYIRTTDDIYNYFKATTIVLIPFAILLLMESAAGSNYYTIVGARLTDSIQRLGKIRAAGPFGTPILTGTVGALNLASVFILWKGNRKLAIVAACSCISIMLASASSTPFGAAFILVTITLLYKHRKHCKRLIWTGTVLLVILHFVKERPIWYLIALVDIVGGSTGWHRSRLIDQAFLHLKDWWLIGTDYTANWMPYSLPSIPNHCDLTNYYIHLGVIAGMPAALILAFINYKAITQLASIGINYKDKTSYISWILTATVTTHAITFLTISYYDQIYVFFYISIAMVPAILTAQDRSKIITNSQ